MNLNKIKLSTKNKISLFILCFLISFVGLDVWGWTAPTSTPPGGNRPTPLNVSDTEQQKTGNFFLKGDLIAVGGVHMGGNIDLGVSNRDTYNREEGDILNANRIKGYNDLTLWAKDYTALQIPEQDVIWMDGSNNIIFKTGGTERMRIDSSGNIGIATSSPGFALDVAGSINLTGTIYQNGSELTTGYWTATSTSDIYYNPGSGNGYVGIGTASPVNPLQVSGAGGQYSALPDGFHMGTDGSGNAHLELVTSGGTPYIDFLNDNVGDRDARIRLTSNGVLEIESADLHLDNELEVAGTGDTTIAGNVGIGTVSPLSKLQIGSSSEVSSDSYITFGRRETSSESNFPFIGHYSSDGVDNWLGLGAHSTGGGIGFFVGNSTAFDESKIGMVLSASGRLGIGTTSPDNNYKLTMTGGGIKSESVANPAGYFSSSSGYGLIVNSGNVGIATTTPSYTLEVDGTINATEGLKIGGSDITTGYWSKTGSNVYYNDGNVGIGTSSPNTFLHVQNGSTAYTWDPNVRTVTILEGTAAGSILSIVGDTGEQSSIWFGDTDSQAAGRIRYDHSIDAMSFWAGQEKMRIISNGNVGIGTTTPAYTLDVDGDGRFTGDLIVTGNNLTFGNGESIDNEGDGYIDINANQTRFSGNLTYIGTSSDWYMNAYGPSGDTTLYLYKSTDDVANLSVEGDLTVGGSGGISFATKEGSAIAIPQDGATTKSREITFTDGSQSYWLRIYNNKLSVRDHTGNTNSIFTIDSSGNTAMQGGLTTGGDLTVNGGNIILPAGHDYSNIKLYSGSTAHDIGTESYFMTFGPANGGWSSSDYVGYKFYGQDSDEIFRVGNVAGTNTDFHSKFFYDLDVVGDLTVGGTISATINPNLDQGSIPFGAADGSLTEDNSNLYWDSTDKRLGIGTTNPSVKLHIDSSATDTAALAVKSADPTNIAWLYSGTGSIWRMGVKDSSGSALQFGVGDDRYLSIEKSTGNVGIGTTNPTEKLHIDGGNIRLQDYAYIRQNVGNLSGYLWGNYDYNGSVPGSFADAYVLSVNWHGVTGDTDNISNSGYKTAAVKLRRDGTIALMTSAADNTPPSYRMFVNDSGNVGIGTTTPDYTLDVDGEGRFIGDLAIGQSAVIKDGQYPTQSFIETHGSTHGNGLSVDGIANIYLNFDTDSTNDNYLQVLDTGTEVARITSSKLNYYTGSNDEGFHLYDADGSTLLARLTREGDGGRFNLYDGGNVEVQISTRDEHETYFNHGGNVGIATTTPANKLSVIGNIGATSYCDENGNSCDDAASIVGAAGHPGSEYLLNLASDTLSIEEITTAMGLSSADGFSKCDDTTAPAPGCFEVTGYHTADNVGPYWKVDQNSEYIFETWVKVQDGAGDTDGHFYAGWEMYDAAKTSFGNTQRYWGSLGEAFDEDSRNDGEWHLVRGRISGTGSNYNEFIDGTEYAKIVLLMNYQMPSDAKVRFAGMKLYESRDVTTSLYLTSKDRDVGSAYTPLDSSVLLQVGDEDYDAGYAGGPVLAVGSENTTEGGEIKLYTAADSDDNVDSYIIDAYNDDLRIRRNGVSDLVLSDEGYLGIGTGTTDPAYALDVNGDISVGDYIRDASGDKAFRAVDSGDRWIALDNSGAKAGIWDYYGSGDDRFAVVQGGETYFLNSNVGIGTSSPSAKLDISGDLIVAGNTIGFVNHDFDASIEVNDGNPYNTGAEFHFNGDGSTNNATIYGEVFHATDKMYADYLVDNNATSYDVDPAGTSNMNIIDFGGGHIDWDGNYLRIGHESQHVYLNSGSNNIYLYGSGIYLGYSSGDNIELRDNQMFGDDWIINDGGAGNWGIGTTEPVSALDVRGTLTLGDAAAGVNSIIPEVSVNGGNRTLRFNFNSSDTQEGFQFYNDNTDTSLMMIQGDGNVGIGVTDAYANLDVGGSSRFRDSVNFYSKEPNHLIIPSAELGSDNYIIPLDDRLYRADQLYDVSVNWGPTSYSLGNCFNGEITSLAAWSNTEIAANGDIVIEITGFGTWYYLDTMNIHFNWGYEPNDANANLKVECYVSDNSEWVTKYNDAPTAYNNYIDLAGENYVTDFRITLSGQNTSQSEVRISEISLVGAYNGSEKSKGHYLHKGGGDLYGNLDMNNNSIVNATINPGLDQGSIPFGDADGSLTEDNSNLYWDNASSSLGIGTTGPDETLHVEGNILLDAYNAGAGSGIFFREGFSPGTSGDDKNVAIRLKGMDSPASPDGLEFDAYDGITFNTNYTDRMVIDPDGNVGIGTTTPDYTLDVDGDGRFTGDLIVGGNDIKDSGGSAGITFDGNGNIDISRNLTNPTIAGTSYEYYSTVDSNREGYFYASQILNRTRVADGQQDTGLAQSLWLSSLYNDQDAASYDGGTLDDLWGMSIQHGIYSGANATVKRSRGIVISPYSNEGTIESMMGIRIKAASTEGTITSRYGLYIDDVNQASDNNYAIYTESGDVRFGGDLTVGGSLNMDSIALDGNYIKDSKSVSLDSGWTSVLSVDFGADHKSAYVKLFYGGSDWTCHSAVRYQGEFEIMDGSGGYGEPGHIILQKQNTYTDQIQARIVHVDPNIVSIQLRTYDVEGDGFSCSDSTTGGTLVYEVEGAFSSIVDSTDTITASSTSPGMVFNGGNVGIGTTGPGAKLEVAGNAVLSKTGTATSDSDFPSYSLIFRSSGWDTNWPNDRNVDWYIRNEADASIYPNSYLTFYEESPSYNHWKVKLPGFGSGSGYMHSDAAYFNGNVGIGTTTPDYTLDVDGHARVNGRLYLENGEYFQNGSNGYIDVGATYLRLNGTHLLDSVGPLTLNAWNDGATTTVLVTNGGGSPVELDVEGEAKIRDDLYVNASGYHIVFSTDTTNRTIMTVDEGNSFTQNNRVSNVYWNSPEQAWRFDDNLTVADNVGIGTTSPNYPLTIYSASTADEFVPLLKLAKNSTSDVGSVGILFGISGGANEGKGGIAYKRIGSYGRGDMYFLQDNAADGENAVISDAVMTIRNSGNVGIGTTTPGYKLDVEGNASIAYDLIVGDGDITVTGTSYIDLHPKNSTYGVIIRDVDRSDWTNIETTDTYTAIGFNNDDGPLFIDDADNVGIGTANPSSALEVAGWYGRTAHNNGGLVGSYNNVAANSYKSNPIYVIGSNYKPNDASLGNMYGIGYTHTNASFVSGGSGWGLYVAADGDARIWLNGSTGDIYANAFYYSSDIRLKEKIESLTTSTENILDLNPVQFKFKEKEGNNLGFIAQEVEEIFPELIRTDDSEEKLKSINYSGLIAPLVKTVQEQHSLIEDQEKEIKELKELYQEQQEEIKLIKEKINK